jgi:hypothetical protein
VKDEERADLTTDEVKQQYGSSRSLLHIISCTMQDAAYILRLMCELNVLPLALQITKIAGESCFMYNLGSEIWCFHSADCSWDITVGIMTRLQAGRSGVWSSSFLLIYNN